MPPQNNKSNTTNRNMEIELTAFPKVIDWQINIVYNSQNYRMVAISIGCKVIHLACHYENRKAWLQLKIGEIEAIELEVTNKILKQIDGKKQPNN